MNSLGPVGSQLLMRRVLWMCAVSVVCLAGAGGPASAQILEAPGSRALGMGGAFVAVANDSSATWWNPAGLATGPFLDMALARALTEVTETLPARRDRASWFALGTLPFGVSYYRLRVTDVGPFDPGHDDLAADGPGPGVPIQSLPVSQLGATFVQTVSSGVHVGTTVKWVRGRFLSTHEEGAVPEPTAQQIHDLLERGDNLGGGRAENRFDADFGVLATGGGVRVGAVLRNVRAPQFGEVITLPRQLRVGAAFDASMVSSMALTIALDADLRTYDTITGPRRVLALGAEQWLFSRRFGVRAGARFNRAGEDERVATAGVSVGLRTGMYIDAHIVHGGTTAERGWGLASRVSF